jgi:hypothetical protein
MFAIGNSLREARTRRGLAPADVQKGIRIRERYLTALEEERWELLPGHAYTKGFLRTYAEFLGLDGNLYIDEYNARVADHDEEPLVPESLAAARRTRRGVLRMLLGVLVLGAVVAGIAALGTRGSSPTATGAKAPKRAVRGKLVVSAIPAVRVASRGRPTAKPAARAKTTVITATRGRSWLLVRRGGPTGAILFQNVLERGKTLRFGLAQNLWVRMGRPWNVDVTLGRRRVNGLPVQAGNVLLTQSGSRAA